MSRLWRAMRSYRLAAWLIAALVAMTVLNVLVPQRTYLDAETMERFAADQPALARTLESLGLDAVFGGWMIVLVSALLVTNVIACTWYRIARRRRSPRPPELREGALVPAPSAWDRGASAWADEVRERLGAAGWRILVAEPGRALLCRGASGFLGSMVLHFALLVLIAGGALSSLMAFSGEVVIAEGQELADEPASYLVASEPTLGDPFTGARIALDSVDVNYEDGVVVSVGAVMRAITAEGRVIEKDVRVNHPLDVEGTSFLLSDTGLAPRITLTYPDGTVEPVVLNLGRRGDVGWYDEFTLETTAGPLPMTLAAASGPVDPADPAVQGSPRYAEPLTITDPRLRISIGIPTSGATDALLAPGDSATLEGITLTFDGLVLWNRYLVRRDPARWVVYLGFWLAIGGAAWRFLVPEKRLALSATDGEEVLFAVVSRPWGTPERDTARILRMLEEE